jgi:CRISPR-associated protein Cmr5
MNKRKVNELIPKAYRVLREVKIENEDKKKKGDSDPYDRIVENNKISKKWLGQISSFGAAIATGSLLSAVAFFNDQGGAELNRKLLIMAIGKLINSEDLLKEVHESMKDAVNEHKMKEEIINAAIALKLSMNLYDLGKGV